MESNRLPALLAYVPVMGWLYVLFFVKDNDLAKFHLQQSIGVFVFLLAAMVGWAAVVWVLAWIPFGFFVGIVLFTMVIVAIGFAIVTWVMGLVYAFQGRMVLLPLFGRMANRMGL